jgi:uncharacterized membrane protein
MCLLSARKIGLLVAATGAAHFAAPDFFEGLTRTVFPENTREWVQRNGATELALGAALTVPKTRKLGVLGLLGYLGFLGSRVVANR